MLADLCTDLLDSRRRAARVTADLEGERLLGPQLAIVNPPLWEIGHVGWFQEYWCLRRRPSGDFGAVDPRGRRRALRFGEGRARHALEPAVAGHRGDARLPRERARARAGARAARAGERRPRAISCAWRPSTRTCTPKRFCIRGRRWDTGPRVCFRLAFVKPDDIEMNGGKFMLGASSGTVIRLRQREMGARGRRSRRSASRALP